MHGVTMKFINVFVASVCGGQYKEELILNFTVFFTVREINIERN